MNNRHLVLLLLLLLAGVEVLLLSGCGDRDGCQILRIGHNQSTDYPTNIAMLAFEKFIESKLPDRYDVEVYPSELLGSQTDMVQLTQTGAITFCVASNAILETFSINYSLFNLPYLFASQQAFYGAMGDPAVTEPIFGSTKQAGFRAVTWLDAGTRNFYTVNTPIRMPADLKGLKIRVQQSPTNVQMMNLLGGSATPMGFGEVYTALQSHVIDGAENNEMTLISKGHGDVCKYYSYNMHQIIPDILIANCAFLDSLSGNERKIFEEGFKLVNRVQRDAWDRSVDTAVAHAVKKQGVTFIHPEVKPFRDICLPMHEAMLKKHPNLRPIYGLIQAHNTAKLQNGAVK